YHGASLRGAERGPRALPVRHGHVSREPDPGGRSTAGDRLSSAARRHDRPGNRGDRHQGDRARTLAQPRRADVHDVVSAHRRARRHGPTPALHAHAPGGDNRTALGYATLAAALRYGHEARATGRCGSRSDDPRRSRGHTPIRRVDEARAARVLTPFVSASLAYSITLLGVARAAMRSR